MTKHFSLADSVATLIFSEECPARSLGGGIARRGRSACWFVLALGVGSVWIWADRAAKFSSSTRNQRTLFCTQCLSTNMLLEFVESPMRNARPWPMRVWPKLISLSTTDPLELVCCRICAGIGFKNSVQSCNFDVESESPHALGGLNLSSIKGSCDEPGF